MSFAQLADSPWPSYQNNARNTGLSPYAGPETDSLLWKYGLGRSPIQEAAVIGPNGTVYINRVTKHLMAFNRKGFLKWKFKTEAHIYTTPVVGSNGTIYITPKTGPLHAIDSDGTLKWKYDLDSGNGNASPTIGTSGTIYVGQGNIFHAINPDGNLKWKFETNGDLDRNAALGPDGTVYVVSTNDILYALSQQGDQKWKFQLPDYPSAPTVSSEGTVYVGILGGSSDTLYAINPKGRVGDVPIFV